ncbi:tRNA pseudouridine38-40 synthase [Catalinimonas alkaloidigena]|uniref:tRNA pseudouridine(38-40) synthase TruA n=1 Tax=Catalinimonas alkaloidigena TaxID=1075417 RepID=UPI002406E87B|nr:tRNA pseudouridine(38-40) synthase TruA [Catalinimonas alkaloidigena]MDF9795152.1 tRNA pseudouridine38-40 synthase [Catalinimonas alkaloidigena]
MRYFLQISYKGSRYHGWQIQKNAKSIQAIINDTLSKILGEEISITGSGRTDTGVHAVQQYAHFDTSKKLIPEESQYRFNALLPHDISIQAVLPVTDNAHSRFDAHQRNYQYHIHQVKSPFLYGFSYYFRPRLDLEKMNIAAAQLATGEEQDYECFSKSRSSQQNYLCKIEQAEWQKKDHSRIVFYISANRFLRNMVRAIVGTMLDIGTHKISLNDFEKILQSKDRKRAGRSVPAEGLYLSQVSYPPEIFS